MGIIPGQPGRAEDFIDESERSVDPADDEGKVVKLEEDGKISGEFLRTFKRTVFTSNGTFTLDEKTRYLEVEGVGGGGGSGGAASDDGSGAGGAAGGYFKKVFQRSEVDASVAVTIGAAGSAGGVSTSGGDGGTTSFGSLLIGNGGKGGYCRTCTPHALDGGTATGGDINITGQKGQEGQAGSTVSGMGGGGSCPLGLGGLAAFEQTGQKGTGFGAGAAGAHRGGSNRVGAEGQPGIIIVTEYF
jgi:hypothetical protein